MKKIKKYFQEILYVIKNRVSLLNKEKNLKRLSDLNVERLNEIEDLRCANNYLTKEYNRKLNMLNIHFDILKQSEKRRSIGA